MTDRELMQMALDALDEHLTNHERGCVYLDPIITALRERLAQPEKTNQCGETCERAKLCAVCAREMTQPEQEQEPVAWMSSTPTNGDLLHWTKQDALRWAMDVEPLYTAPPTADTTDTVELTEFLKLAKAQIRQQALEEAARVCDLLLSDPISSDWARATHDCAAAIRKLTEPEQEPLALDDAIDRARGEK